MEGKRLAKVNKIGTNNKKEEITKGRGGLIHRNDGGLCIM